MDEIDFTHILDHGDRPEPTPEVLGRIVARHHRRQARRYQVVATSAVVVALAGAGIGLGLQGPGGRQAGSGAKSALGDAPPAGLTWETPSAAGQPASTFAVNGAEAPPGAFGFGSAATTSGPVAPAAMAGAANSASTQRLCKRNGCTVYYEGNTPRLVFERHVDGLTISAYLELYAYPASPVPLGKAPTAPATGAKAPTNPPTPGTVPAGTSSKTALPAIIACPPPSELLVKVAGYGMSNTLYVPAGAATDHPFSVVASAATTLPDGRTVVLVVARTSQSVSSVSAAFPGGGSDAMAPVSGWVVLGQRLNPGSAPSKSSVIAMVAKSSSGRVLETARLPESGALATAPAVAVCHVLVVPNPVNVSPPPTGSVTGPPSEPGGTTGSGVATPGSATSGSASASPGTR